MLPLLLALVAYSPPDTTTADVLRVCDRPFLADSCALYLSGFLDAVRAQDEEARRTQRTVRDLDVAVLSFACLRGRVDVDAVRLRVVAELKRNPSRLARASILDAISKMYPCAVIGSTQGTSPRPR